MASLDRISLEKEMFDLTFYRHRIKLRHNYNFEFGY
jgi:hypothetical protein